MATRLNKIEVYVVNTVTGLPVPNASVEVRRQGATVVSGGPTTFTIENPGAIRHSGEVGAPASDSATAYTAAGLVRDASVRGVSALTATSITVATGFSGVVDDDRLSPTTNLPTLFEDSEGTETKPNPLTTNANGHAYAWIAASVVDALVSGGDPPNGPVTTRLLIDQACIGGNVIVVNAWGTGSQVFTYLDTLRDATSGDKLFSGRERGSELWHFDHTGKLFVPGFQSTAASTITSGGLTVTAGGLTVSAGGAAITGNSTIAGTLGSLTGITMTSGDFVTSGTTTKIRAARLAINRGVIPVTGDFSINASWGSGASVNTVSGREARGQVVVVSGTSGFSAHPQITYTFPGGAFTDEAPFIVAVANESTGTKFGFVCNQIAQSATAVTMELTGYTPASTETVTITWILVG